MPDYTFQDAIRHRTDADVDPLDMGRLPGWGWDRAEAERPIAPKGEPFRGIVWGVLIALGLWCVILTGLYWLLKVGVWR